MFSVTLTFIRAWRHSQLRAQFTEEFKGKRSLHLHFAQLLAQDYCFLRPLLLKADSELGRLT